MAIEIELRHEEPAEQLESMHAHKGTCIYCTGVVKMQRSLDDARLLPNSCHCFGCGQRYFMKIEDLDEWENEQWMQKGI